MSNHDSRQPNTGTGWYEIRIRGHLAPRWARRFEPMTLTAENGGTTLIRGPVVDQAALHGLLHQLSDLGLPLISLAPTDPDPTPISGANRPAHTKEK